MIDDDVANHPVSERRFPKRLSFGDRHLRDHFGQWKVVTQSAITRVALHSNQLARLRTHADEGLPTRGLGCNWV